MFNGETRPRAPTPMPARPLNDENMEPEGPRMRSISLEPRVRSFFQAGDGRRRYDGKPDSYRNTLETSPGTGPAPYATTPRPKTSSTRPSRDPFRRVREGCRRLTPVSAHSSVPAGQMGSRAMVFGRPRYAGNLNALACVLDSSNRHGSPCRGRSAQALK
jgi:hypothetical protein